MPQTHSSFVFHETKIEGVFLVEPKVHGDNRGFFMEAYKRCDFEAAGLPFDFVQENHSLSVKGVLRGLHFQRTRPQAKLIRVLAGEIFDVAVDLRKGSETYGRSVCVELSSSNRMQLLIPRGFAHGFMVMSQQAEIVYLCDDYYVPGDEGGIAYNDPTLAIPWPSDQVVLSDKDKNNPLLSDCGIVFDPEHPGTAL